MRLANLPQNIHILAVCIAFVPTTLPGLPAAGYDVDTLSREEVLQFYRSVYFASAGVEMGWTGNYETGNPGSTSPEFQEAVRRRINFYRAMAGVPAWVELDAEFNRKDQHAALMMSVNEALSHDPPSSWTFYTEDGWEAAQNSNVAIGTSGAESIDGYIVDPGAGNAAVGHRRWLLHPPHRVMGSGDVPGNEQFFAANANWVFDGNTFASYPELRDPMIAWPPAGYFPYTLVPARWSIAAEDADFADAQVLMWRGGVPIDVLVEPGGRPSSSGSAHFVWVPDDWDVLQRSDIHPSPGETDITYTIEVSNVMVNGSPVTFDYDVVVFDPTISFADPAENQIAGPATAAFSKTNLYQIDKFDFATHFETRVIETEPVTWTEGAEEGTGRFNVTTGDYQPVTPHAAFSGSHGFHLGHVTGDFSDQILELRDTFVASSDAAIAFQSRLGWASPTQTARMEYSTDNGNSWTTAWSRDGTGNSGQLAFSLEQIDLAPLAGQTVNLRFRYHATGEVLLGVDPGVGWMFDDIQPIGLESIVAVYPGTVSTGSEWSRTFWRPGEYGVQSRALAFGGYPLQWSPVREVSVSADGFLENPFADLPTERGWKRSGLGAIYDADWPLLYHREHGHLMAAGESSGIYLLEFSTGEWLWTDLRIWPAYYNLDTGDWLLAD